MNGLASTNALRSLSQSFAQQFGLSGPAAIELPLRQHWLDEPEAGFRPALVSLYPRPSGLGIVATLQDEDIYNTATVMNQRTWMLGDVLEVFVASPGRPEYWEFHVTPENQRLQLKLSPERFMAVNTGKLKMEDNAIADPQFLQSSNTFVNQAENYWQAHLFLPWLSIDLLPSQPTYKLEAAFCRYDRTRGVEEPVLSATPSFSKPRYHNRPQWDTLTLHCAPSAG